MTHRIPKTIEWIGGLDGYVQMIDQTLLPGELKMMQCRTAQCVWEAIRSLRVRGAPAIGIAAAMGLVLGVRGGEDRDEDAFFAELRRGRDYLASARPTAVNLCWALDRMMKRAQSLTGSGVPAFKDGLLAEARQIRDEDAASCRAIGRNGVPFIPAGGVLTHCNAGSLATAEYGTALAAIYAAHEQGKRCTVYATETRPLLQGSRLTAWELSQAGIDVVTICDSAVAQVMREQRVQCVMTGADRIAANGDAANKIGTYGIALLAQAHRIPFYVAAPASTFDLSCPSGAGIPIEQRSADEVRAVLGRATAPAEVQVYNPAFDVTPAELIAAIITDRGVIQPVSQEEIRRILSE